MNYDLIESIEADPVVESIVELRFEAEVPDSAVVGILYSALREKFPKLESLPISQLPEPMRASDPNLRFKAVHKLIGEKVDVQIGPRVITMGGHTDEDYIGWRAYSEIVFDVTSRIFGTGIIESVHRVGVRYISFFPDTNIYQNIRLKLELEGRDAVTEGNTSVVTELRDGDVVNRLSLQNNAKLNRGGVPAGQGSIIDIDSYLHGNFPSDSDVNKAITTCKKAENRTFFSLLTPEFLQSCNPTFKNPEVANDQG